MNINGSKLFKSPFSSLLYWKLIQGFTFHFPSTQYSFILSHIQTFQATSMKTRALKKFSFDEKLFTLAGVAKMFLDSRLLRPRNYKRMRFRFSVFNTFESIFTESKGNNLLKIVNRFPSASFYAPIARWQPAKRNFSTKTPFELFLRRENEWQGAKPPRKQNEMERLYHHHKFSRSFRPINEIVFVCRLFFRHAHTWPWKTAFTQTFPTWKISSKAYLCL